MNIETRLLDSLKKGFLDEQTNIDEAVRTKFLTNDVEKKVTVLETIKLELKKCKTFTFSVAFITQSGLNELKTILFDLDQKGIKGRIITSNYLAFNNPEVYKELLKINNIDVRVTDSKGFHAKGYLFEHEEYSTLVLGSSNLTSSALKINHEWNLKVSSLSNGEIVKEISQTINEIWDKAEVLTEDWVSRFELVYKAPIYNLSENIVNEPSYYQDEIIPNKMQTAALQGIEDVRSKGESKALLISATGTGKTYLSAFDVKAYEPKRFLFIVHREQILRESIKSFQRVIQNNESEYGVLSGQRKDYDAKYLFATIQSLSTDYNLNKFNKDDFDYIVIDEVHKSGAPSYEKVMNHFEPKFMLGMTATPERTDDINIYKIFDYNIAYEIRLQEAMEEELICPFHYFGVTDYEKDGEIIDDTSTLSDLVSEERINHLIDKMNYYGHSGKMVKGLIFTSSREEAREVSILLNQKGYRTTYLTGENSHEERETAIKDLNNGILQYIITVDIFNEGIDIPSVNQVVMMRETQSSIIFIQQLGRGLRLHDNKEFVTIIDYIGNYKNNYMIPLALSGDTSFNEDILRKNTIDTSYISGISSVNFEEIAKERIFDSIASAKLSSISNLRKEYISLKNRIGKIPLLIDFYNEKSVDPEIIGTAKKSYYSFLLSYDKDFSTSIDKIDDESVKVLELLSREFLNGKRVHEVLLLEYLLTHKAISMKELEFLYKENGLYFSDKTIDSVIAMLDMTFYTSATRNTYAKTAIITVNDEIIKFTESVEEMLTNDIFRMFFVDVIETTKLVNEKYDKTKQFTIGELYTRRDSTRLLEWGKDISGTIFGYSIRDGECPIFVTYNKVDVEHSVNYKDGFINSNTFRWYTRSRLTTNSEEAKNIINSEENDIRLNLFVKKDDITHETNFYYLGEVTPIKGSEEDELMADGKSVVRMDFSLKESLTENLYDYMIS